MRVLNFELPAMPELQRFLSLAWLRVRPLTAFFRIDLGEDVDIEGRVWVPGTGRVHLGRGVRLRGRRAPIELRAHEGAEIRLGDGVVVEAGASIEATQRVEIGARVSIGAFAKIIDNHYHHTVGDRARRPAAVPIFIGDDAIIGPRAILLPGARVAARAVVGAGQVLSSRQETAAPREPRAVNGG
jgi:acetyltransferase-like isoleucine patch superfamily enzyme